MTQRISVSLEVKTVGDREFEGHGSVFKNVDLGGDIVMPGAFKRTLAKHRKDGTLPAMFWMHDAAQVPGKWVDMGEDSKGLYVKGVFADTQLGNEVRTLLHMKAVRGLSIGYVPKDVDFDDDGVRLIKEAELWEVSVVSLAMNPLAQVESVKSRLSVLGEYVPTVKEFERILRNAGCTRSTAKLISYKIRMLEDEEGEGVMSEPEPRNVEVQDPAKALREIAEKIMADSIRLKFST
jgi:HK97 family phage prohead protease